MVHAFMDGGALEEGTHFSSKENCYFFLIFKRSVKFNVFSFFKSVFNVLLNHII